MVLIDNIKKSPTAIHFRFQFFSNPNTLETEGMSYLKISPIDHFIFKSKGGDCIVVVAVLYNFVSTHAITAAVVTASWACRSQSAYHGVHSSNAAGCAMSSPEL